MSDFWPREDRIKMVQIFDAVADNITPPSSADIGRFDPHARFRQPDPTKDPENPAMYTTWHIETHTPEPVLVPDSGSRSMEIIMSFWTEIGAVEGGVSGMAELLAEEYYRELKVPLLVSGVTFIPQLMQYLDGPFGRIGDFQESQMKMPFHINN